MSCAAVIRKDESYFNLAHRIVSVIVESNSLNFDETWTLVSTNTIQQLQKRFRKIRRANNPLVNVKKPRTAFSFYTKNCRTKIANDNPKATFGELSKLVSKAWGSLSEKEKSKYKKMETEDRARYAAEKEKVLAESAQQSEEVTTTETSNDVEEPVSETKSTKKRKTTTSSEKSAKGSKATKTSKSSTESNSSKKSKSSSTTVKPYNVFQKEQRPLLKESNPNMPLKEVNSKLGAMWKALSTEQKARYSTVGA